MERHNMKTDGFSIMICVACGILDATCFVALGGTFVGLMTGNLILMGVSMTGYSAGVEPGVFLYPLGGYSAGALAAGLLFRLTGAELALRVGLWLGCALLVVVTALVFIMHVRDAVLSGWVVVLLTAAYTGFQSAVLYLSKRSTVTTNVMTSTLTSFLADFAKQLYQGQINWQKFFAIIGFVTGVVIGGASATHDIRIAYLLSVVLVTIAVIGLSRPSPKTA